MKGSYLTKVDGYVLPLLKRQGLTLIKSEFVQEDGLWYLRVYIDLTEEEYEKRRQAVEELKAEREKALAEAMDGAESEAAEEAAGEKDEIPDPGVTINDCAAVSRPLSKWLDKEDFISETYTLEVCSRGFLNEVDQEGDQ